jgi:hypothetical protein
LEDGQNGHLEQNNVRLKHNIMFEM